MTIHELHEQSKSVSFRHLKILQLRAFTQKIKSTYQEKHTVLIKKYNKEKKKLHNIWAN